MQLTERKKRSRAFSLIELLVVIGIIGVLASLILPALGHAKAKAHSITCLNHLRQLHVAWLLYAGDHNDKLVYNLGAAETKQAARGQLGYANWANNVLNWELDADNTNAVLVREAALGAYIGGTARIFRCPSDSVLSRIQREAGWAERLRSLSMNAMVGDAGEFTRGVTNMNNPAYKQFQTLADFPRPAAIFVFIEEHPDSINDGYFLNRPARMEWIDLPASYHDGAANLAFGDGHVETRRWLEASTRPPSRPDEARLPFDVPEQERRDFDWLMRRTSVYERHVD